MILLLAQRQALPWSLHPALTAAMLLMAAGTWVLLWRLQVGRGVRARVLSGGRLAAGLVMLLAMAELMSGAVVLATNWPIWPLALGGAVATEATVWLYRRERRGAGRRAGLALVALRAAVLLLVLGMLAQPVWSRVTGTLRERYVAVLLDDSASMLLADERLAATDLLRLAELAGVDTPPRPHNLAVDAAETLDLHQALVDLGDRLAVLEQIAADDRDTAWAARQKDVHALLASAAERTQARRDALGTLRDSDRLAWREGDAALLDDLHSRLLSLIEQLTRAGGLATRQVDAAGLGRLRETVHLAARSAHEAAGMLRQAAGSADAAFLAAMPEAKRDRVGAMAQLSRTEIARLVMLQPGPDGRSLLDSLGDRYTVRMWHFAADARQIDAARWVAGPGGETPPAGDADAATPPADLDDLWQEATDYGRAFEAVVAAVPAGQLGGIVVVGDGRHVSAGGPSPEEFAARLGRERTVVCSIVLGSEEPPRDAAIVAVDVPDAIHLHDRAQFHVDLKLDGLAGESVTVALYLGEEAVDRRELSVPAETFRARVTLAHEPDQSGLHAYEVRIAPLEAEAFADNNVHRATVHVREDRIRVLLVEGRPRWEFGYLRNLFSDRDPSVRLQYVLLEPDVLAEAPQRQVVHASASRDLADVEATSLPENADEWMKFDVIILGDVAPQDLGVEHQEALGRFVRERAGSLVVIAGPRYMPHAYAQTPLAGLLPVTVTPADAQGAASGAPRYVTAPEPAFRLELTDAGRASVVLRQASDDASSQAIWRAVAEMTWRYPVQGIAPGASVLAWAMPVDPQNPSRASDEVPQFARPDREDAPLAPTPQDAEELLRLRRAYEQRQALLVTHHVEAGRVLFWATDRSWRLRYRVGDARHHRFWGQVVRWATGEQLPGGTVHVQIGTDQRRYGRGERVRVRARLLRTDWQPIDSEQVAVRLLQNGEPVVRRAMAFVPGSHGLYEADLGELPVGLYEAHLDAPDAGQTLREGGATEAVVSFSVDASLSAERVELTADAGFAARLAELSGGVATTPGGAWTLLEALGPHSQVEELRHDYRLWDNWPLLALLVGLLGAEWLVRKKAGLP